MNRKAFVVGAAVAAALLFATACQRVTRKQFDGLTVQVQSIDKRLDNILARLEESTTMPVAAPLGKPLPENATEAEPVELELGWVYRISNQIRLWSQVGGEEAQEVESIPPGAIIAVSRVLRSREGDIWYEVYVAVPVAGEEGNILKVGDEVVYFWPSISKRATGWVKSSDVRRDTVDKLARAPW